MFEKFMKQEVKEKLNLPFEKKVKISKTIIAKAGLDFKNMGLGFSGGTDSLILLHMTLPILSKVKVVFINTYNQFPETYAFIQKVRRHWDFDLHEFKADWNRIEQFKALHGFKTGEFTVKCCEYHKINPKLQAIKTLKLDGFLSGIRGVEHEERAKEIIFSPREDHTRVHPMLFWKRKDVMDYVRTRKIECNPLYAEGYTSLGCKPCTDKNPESAHERGGRGVVREKWMKHMRDLGYD